VSSRVDNETHADDIAQDARWLSVFLVLIRAGLPPRIVLMRNITLAFAVAMALLSFGCKKKSAASGEAMAKMSEFKDRMCQCAEHDAQCAQNVSDEMTKWSQEQSTTAAKMSEEDTKKAAAISEELGACMQKAMTPAAAPAGEVPAGEAPEGEAPAGEAPAGEAAAPAGEAPAAEETK
jgi:Sec-independent protein translocase protein TatA